MCAFCVYVLVAAIICGFVTLRSREDKKKWKKERKTEVEWMEDCQCCALAWCVALGRDNRMPTLLAYLCCTPHSCFCCLPLPAKSHPATTWGRRSAPPGPCSSSSGQRQITNANHLLILVIKETLITADLDSSAAMNGHKLTISETVNHASTVHCWESGQLLCVCV